MWPFNGTNIVEQACGMSIVKADIAIFGTTITALNTALIAHQQYRLKVALFTNKYMPLIPPQHICAALPPDPNIKLWALYHALFLSHNRHKPSDLKHLPQYRLHAHVAAFAPESVASLKCLSTLLSSHEVRCKPWDPDHQSQHLKPFVDGYFYGHVQRDILALDPIRLSEQLLSQIEELDIELIELDDVRHVEKREESYFVELDAHPIEADHAAFMCDHTVAHHYGHQIRQMRPKLYDKSTLISSEDPTLKSMLVEIIDADIQLMGTPSGHLIVNGPGDYGELSSELVRYFPHFASLPLVGTRTFNAINLPDRLPCVGTYRTDDAFVAFSLTHWTGLMDELITHCLVKQKWPEKIDPALIPFAAKIEHLFSPRRFETGNGFQADSELRDDWQIGGLVGVDEEAPK